jgi:virulence factor Mce-like protein
MGPIPLRALLATALLAVGLFAGGCSGGDDPTRFTAVFDNATNLFVGSEVRVLGLEVGQVTAIAPRGEVVEVEMAVDADQPLPADATAEIKPIALLGERIVQIGPPYTGGPRLEDGATIGRERTGEPAEVDEVLASFEQFLEGLDRRALADLIDSMAGTLSGQGKGLNELVDEGSETVRVLADASDDLNALVTEFAELNETLATRDERIGSTLEEFSTTLQTLVEEREEILGTVGELHRLTAELRPLLDAHGDELVGDLEQVTTSLSTVERNLERLGDAARGANELFAGTGEAIQWDLGALNLHNKTEDIGGLVVDRVVQRLVGLCLRLEIEECAEAEFFADVVDEATNDRDEFTREVGEVIADLIGALPEEAQAELGEAPGAPPPEGDGESGGEPEPEEPEGEPDESPEPPEDPEELLDDLLEDAP